jgi:hypothetical protein
MHSRVQSGDDPENERGVRHGWILPRAWTGQVRISAATTGRHTLTSAVRVARADSPRAPETRALLTRPGVAFNTMPPSPRRRAAVRPAQPARALATRPPLRRLLWALYRLKSGKPLRATDLAREFEVAVRTAYRDLDFLRDEWRVPLEYDHHQATGLAGEPRRVSLPGPGAALHAGCRGLPRDPDRTEVAPPRGRAVPEPQQQPHGQPPHPAAALRLSIRRHQPRHRFPALGGGAAVRTDLTWLRAPDDGVDAPPDPAHARGR